MLNQTMLNEFEDVILHHSELPEGIAVPVHQCGKLIIEKEYEFEDFLSRETAGSEGRADPIRSLIVTNQGDPEAFNTWFSTYETPKVKSAAPPAWDS